MGSRRRWLHGPRLAGSLRWMTDVVFELIEGILGVCRTPNDRILRGRTGLGSSGGRVKGGVKLIQVLLVVRGNSELIINFVAGFLRIN